MTEKWGHWLNAEEEGPAVGGFSTKAEAIDAGRRAHSGEPFCVGIQREIDLGDYAPNAELFEEILEQGIADTHGFADDAKVSIRYESCRELVESELAALVKKYFVCDTSFYYEHVEDVI